MFYLPAFLAFFFAFALVVAGDASDTGRYRNISRVGGVKLTTKRQFHLVDMYRGQDFLNDFTFFDGPDPTNGNVAYQSKEDAIVNGLAFVQEDGTTVLAVDDKTPLRPGDKRKSVRIESKKTYNGGLFIFDVFAMPHGPSVWPAMWTLGPNWPFDGEIDVFEGVHDQEFNRYTLHTGPNCFTSPSSGEFTRTGTVDGDNCESPINNNAGCGFLDSDTRTYGRNFNFEAGGVYAMHWNNRGIKIWHFARPEIPGDILSEQPEPSTWGTPAAAWSTETCDMASHFSNHRLIVNTSICGDLGNGLFGNEQSCPGCAAKFGTCAQAAADPANFEFAKWKLNYIAVYSE